MDAFYTMSTVNIQTFAQIAHTSRTQVYRMIERGELSMTANKQLLRIEALRIGVEKTHKTLLSLHDVKDLSMIHYGTYQQDEIQLTYIISQISSVFSILYNNPSETTQEALYYLMMQLKIILDKIVDTEDETMMGTQSMNDSVHSDYQDLILDIYYRCQEDHTDTTLKSIYNIEQLQPMTLIQDIQTLLKWHLDEYQWIDEDVLSLFKAYIELIQHHININYLFNRHPHAQTLRYYIGTFVENMMRIHLPLKK